MHWMWQRSRTVETSFHEYTEAFRVSAAAAATAEDRIKKKKTAALSRPSLSTHDLRQSRAEQPGISIHLNEHVTSLFMLYYLYES